MSNLKDENGNTLVGYIDVGGPILPRTWLAKVLPDIECDEQTDIEIAELIRHMARRDIDATDFAHLCAISMGCLIELECDGNTEKAKALGSLVTVARCWADMAVAH